MPPSGPDLRLVPAALACWLVCVLAVGSDARGVLVVGGGALLLVGLVLVVLPARSRARRAGPEQQAGSHGEVDPAQHGTVRATAWLAVVACLGALLSCAAQLHLRDQGLLAQLVSAGAVVQVQGVVRSDPVALPDPWAAPAPADATARAPTALDDPDRYRLVLAAREVTGRGRTAPAAAGLVVIGGPELATVRYGSTLRVTGRLSATAPGDRAVALLRAQRPGQVLAPPGAVDAQVVRLREALLEVTDGLSPDARGLVPGAAIGDTTRLPADLDQAMRDTGLTHITAVSGAHFAVLSVTALALTALLRLPVVVRAALCAGVMAGFVLLVRPEPSVVRAAAMGAVAVLGLLAGRRSSAVSALGGAVVVLLVLDPWLARTYGFVLSVLATGAIVLAGPPLARVLGRLLPHRLAVVVAVPVVAQAACAPVLVLLDPSVALYAVPANVLAAPALLPATLLGVVATLLAPLLPGPATVLAHGAAAATWWIALVARGFAGLPGARQPWPEGVGGALALALATVVLVAMALAARRMRGRPRRVLLGAVVCLALVVLPDVRSRLLATVPDGWPPTDWQVVACDVGQGDALVLRSGPRAAVVVDVGPDESADRCLTRLGVDRIDLLVLSHHHADHVAGLAPVLSGRHVELALVSPLAPPGGQASATFAQLAAADVPVRVGAADGADGALAAGTAGSVGWQVLWPVRAPPGGVRGTVARLDVDGSALNDASLVLRLQSAGLSVVALGDVEPGGQQGLLRSLATEGGEASADVVKVAHHGSAYQLPALADRLRPTVALVSAGRDNSYGHPAPSTLDLYRGTGAAVLSTHECGPIALAGDSERVTVFADCLAR